MWVLNMVFKGARYTSLNVFGKLEKSFLFHSGFKTLGGKTLLVLED